MSIIFISEKGVRQKNDKRKDIRTRIRKRRKNIAAKRRENLIATIQSPLLIAVIIVFVALMGYISVQDNNVTDSGLAYSAQAAEETLYKNVIVKSGDTLWGIADKYSDPSKDIRKNIRDICEINDVKPGNIYPGQVIKVPIPASMANPEYSTK